jgi:hypothetical protein
LAISFLLVECTAGVMDIDESFPSASLADVWNKLWDPEAKGEGPGITFESKLVEDLLIAVERESVEHDCPGICDGCTKVCF